MGTKWEYRVEEIDETGQFKAKQQRGTFSLSQGPSEDYVPAKWEDINELGYFGWEAVSVWPNQDGYVFALFKRAIKEKLEGEIND